MELFNHYINSLIKTDLIIIIHLITMIAPVVPTPKTLINQILTNPLTKSKIKDPKRSEKQAHGEVDEVDDGPGRAGGAADDGEDEEPREEEDEDVCGPHARVHEPLGVLVQIRRRPRLNVQLRHQDSILSAPSSTEIDERIGRYAQ